MEQVRSEMLEAVVEDERFRRAECLERIVLFIRQFLSMKKYCIMSFVVALMLTVQFLSIFPPSAFKSEDVKAGRDFVSKTWKRYFRGNSSDRVIHCIAAEEDGNYTGDVISE